MAASVSATPERWFREKRFAIPKVELSVYYSISTRHPFTSIIVIIRHALPHERVAYWHLVLCGGMEEPFWSS